MDLLRRVMRDDAARVWLRSPIQTSTTKAARLDRTRRLSPGHQSCAGNRRGRHGLAASGEPLGPLRRCSLSPRRDRLPASSTRLRPAKRRRRSSPGRAIQSPDSFPVIYLCSTLACVRAELLFSAARQGLEVEALCPRELWAVKLELDELLGLTDRRTLEDLDVKPDELVRPSHEFTQQLGKAAHELRFQGSALRQRPASMK